MSRKDKLSEQPLQPGPASVEERIQQLKNRRAAADKIGRKQRG